LIVQKKPLDIRRLVGCCLKPQAPGYANELEPVAGYGVGLSDLIAPDVNQSCRLFKKLCQQVRWNRVMSNEHNRFNCPFQRADLIADGRKRSLWFGRTCAGWSR
jgi:hypothetical protein